MPSPETSVRRRPTVTAVLGAAVFIVLLAFLNFVTGVYTWVACDSSEALPFSILAGYLVCLLAPLTVLVTLIPVAKRWLSIWFLAPPAAFFVVALGRLAYFVYLIKT
ncbi:hypothetical protein ACGFZQ_13075 [Streptomyces sp. NPDC048254]|uniref:hypothetical protein n=1 Tax=Streptomyces sp. NPDC048254 TaxID=3365525 RepID=UPI00371BD611